MCVVGINKRNVHGLQALMLALLDHASSLFNGLQQLELDSLRAEVELQRRTLQQALDARAAAEATAEAGRHEIAALRSEIEMLSTRKVRLYVLNSTNAGL